MRIELLGQRTCETAARSTQLRAGCHGHKRCLAADRAPSVGVACHEDAAPSALGWTDPHGRVDGSACALRCPAPATPHCTHRAGNRVGHDELQIAVSSHEQYIGWFPY
eukprot:scaffold8469_cov112-Isochrysis_galbana.AAC.2